MLRGGQQDKFDKHSSSLSMALRRAGVKSVSCRAILAARAVELGMSPNEASNLDVVAELIYDVIAELGNQVKNGESSSAPPLAQMLNLLLRAVDGYEGIAPHTGNTLQVALLNVSMALGFIPNDASSVLQPDSKSNGRCKPVATLVEPPTEVA